MSFQCIQGTSPAAKKKANVLDSLLGKEDNISNRHIREEVVIFLEEHPINRDEDPFAWWRGNAIPLPHLVYVACCYLATCDFNII